MIRSRTIQYVMLETALDGLQAYSGLAHNLNDEACSYIMVA